MSQMVTLEAKKAELGRFIGQQMGRVARMIPKHLNAERMLRVAHQTVSRTPSLLKCDPMSIVTGIVEASILGLEVDNVLGHAYLVPFKGRAVLIPGYRGYIDLHRRTGEVSTYELRSVHQGDEFTFEYGLEPKLVHKPHGDDRTGKTLTYVYAIVGFADGSKQFDVMTRAEVDAIRARSRAANDGPWVTDPVAMSKKTVARRFAKVLPLSVEAKTVIEREEHVELGIYDGASKLVDIEGDALPEPKVVEPAAEPKNGNGAEAAAPPKSAPNKRFATKGQVGKLWAKMHERAEADGIDAQDICTALCETLGVTKPEEIAFGDVDAALNFVETYGEPAAVTAGDDLAEDEIEF